MIKEPSNFDNPEQREMLEAYQDAVQLRVAILAELDRIAIKIGPPNGYREYERLFDEIFRPKWIDREALLDCVVYHGLIASSPSSAWERKNAKIDLAGDQNLMAFARRKLEELKQM